MAPRELAADCGPRAAARLSRRAFVSGLAGLGAAALLGSCDVAPRAASNAPVRHIGWLSSNTAPSAQPFLDVWRQAMRELGYLEGRDIVIDARLAENVRDRLPGLATELASLPVDVLVAHTGEAALAATQVTTTIPIVFVQVPDPVGLGLVVSLARPGRNATGTSTLTRTLSSKKIELLKETIPGLAQLAVLWDAHNLVSMSIVLHETEDIARTLGLATEAFRMNDSDKLATVLDAIGRQRPDALLALPLSQGDFAQIPAFAAGIRMPAFYSDEKITRSGGLMSLGTNYPALHRRAAGFVDKILRGASPADLPIEQATQFDLIVNLVAARQIGLAIPDSVLRQATEVIQ